MKKELIRKFNSMVSTVKFKEINLVKVDNLVL